MIRLTTHEYMFGRPYSPDSRDDVVKRLWEYEETGLSPEELKRIDDSYRELATELAEYKKAEDEGRILPIKPTGKVYEVGDDIIREKNGEGDRFYIIESEIQDVSANAIKYADDWIPKDEIGESVFLTREDAEDEMVRMKGAAGV